MSTENELNYDAKVIGRYITKLRKSKNMSMYALALNSGISGSVLLHTEKGQREPRLNTIFRIIDGLEMTPAEFFKPFN